MPNPTLNRRLGKKKAVPFTFPLTTSWISRVAANGGSAVSAGSITALQNFELSITLAGLVPQIKSMCIFHNTGDRIAGLTPFIATVGNGSGGSGRWAENGWTVQIQGSCGFANNCVPACCTIATGISASNFAFDRMGLEIYFSHNAGGAGIWDLGTYNGSGATTFAIGGTVTSGHFLAGLGNTTIDSGVTKLGYLSAERTSASRFDMYYLNAATPTLTNVGTDTTLITDARTVLQYYVFALTVTGGGLVANSGNTLGMVSFTTGLSAADSQTLGTATQTLRTALGCGV